LPGAAIEVFPFGAMTGDPRDADGVASLVNSLGPWKDGCGGAGEAVEHQNPSFAPRKVNTL